MIHHIKPLGRGGGGKYLDRDGIENDSPLKLLVLALLYMYIHDRRHINDIIKLCEMQDK